MVALVAPASPLHELPTMSDDLARVEVELRASAESDDPFLTEVASHLITAGGKRMRPGFCVASAAIGAPEGAAATDDVVMGAVAVELVHLGSLYHDDVMDDAATRRTVESVNARWGNLKAILAGDFLLARASEIAAGLGTEVAALLAATIGRLCEGQVRELKDAYNVDRTEEAYEASITGKTAALFATSCRIGAIVGGLPEAQIETLTEFGRRFGIAFQIVDDVLDVVATEEQLGKPAGNDLVEGVYTLPVIRALASAESGAQLRAVLGKPIDDGQKEEARALLRANGAVADALGVARSYAATAADALDDLADTAPAASMAATARTLVERVEEGTRSG